MAGDGSKVGLLKKSLYGTRGAALNWAEAYSDVLVNKLGFRKGESSPCRCCHVDRKLKLVVHGDDFGIEGSRDELQKLRKEIATYFEIKSEIMGDEGLVNELKLLNRILHWGEQGYSGSLTPGMWN